jgi:DNA-binding PadR family transcriptional regulator
MTLGLNEALILSALAGNPGQSISDIARRLEKADLSRSIDDGSIYIALRRMGERGLVTQTRGKVTSADGRQREIGFYTISAAGASAVGEFQRDVSRLPRLSAASRARPVEALV